MRRAVVLSLVLCAPACDRVFPLTFFDPIPHVKNVDEPTADDVDGFADLTIPPGGPFKFSTSSPGQITDVGPVTTVKVRQDGDESDLVVLEVRDLVVEANGTLQVIGQLGLVIVPRTITIRGVIDASAELAQPGPGGFATNLGAIGEGGRGSTGDRLVDNHSGGGGGGFAEGAGGGGAVDCPLPQDRSLAGGAAGTAAGDPDLLVLQGGRAGGRGGSLCSTMFADGGGGGGALQLTAFQSIKIESTGRIVAGGGGGIGGLGTGKCGGEDSGGAGGGAGGAIYIDAPSISNSGRIEAHGGGGGAGGDGGGNGIDGQTGFNATSAGNPSAGGFSDPTGRKGSSGGAGATSDKGATAATVGCDGPHPVRNSGGGGGGPGRIVFRGAVDLIGAVSPPATELAREAQ